MIAKVRRSPYARFDANRYSVPPDRIQRPLTVLADQKRVRIFDRQELIAEHERSWDKQQAIDKPEHLEALWRSKRRARVHQGQDRLLRAVPQAEELLRALAQRQRHLATAIARLLELLDAFGTRELQAAVAEALEKGSPHPETVRLILDRGRQQRQVKPPMPIQLPDDPRVRDLVVKPHPLADYDPEEES